MYQLSNPMSGDGHGDPCRGDRGWEDCDGPAILLLDGDRNVTMASPSARAMLDDAASLKLVAGTMSATDPVDAVALSSAFRALIGGRDVTRMIRVGKKADEVALQLVALRSDDCRTQVIATIQALGADRSLRIAGIARHFGLTAAEARLLGLLCGGASLIEAAARLGVARTTVRTHLQRIFDKSGTHRQAELVHMVFAA